MVPPETTAIPPPTLLLTCCAQVEPHLAVRRAMDALPGGPSEAVAIYELESRRKDIVSKSATLLSKCVARPEPPMYTSLQVTQPLLREQPKRTRVAEADFLNFFCYAFRVAAVIEFD